MVFSPQLGCYVRSMKVVHFTHAEVVNVFQIFSVLDRWKPLLFKCKCDVKSLEWDREVHYV